MDPAELDRILSGLPVFRDENLLVGYSMKDDASVYRLPSGELVVQTLDFFTPVVDDPYDFGAIAAANALSDIYAMNGRPLFALNICCFPRKHPAEIWQQVLKGGSEKAMEAGIAVVGGHTVDDSEPKYGMVVTGLIREGGIWTNAGAQIGDALILTKPLGTGLITTLLKNGNLQASEAMVVIDSMKTLNRTAAEVLANFEVHACTDITGFGLLGHASEIAQASQVGLEFRVSRVPFFDAALQHAPSGKFPGGTWANRRYLESMVETIDDVAEELIWLLYDAQTSGGLLACVPENTATAVRDALRAAGVEFAGIVGRVTASGHITLLA